MTDMIKKGVGGLLPNMFVKGDEPPPIQMPEPPKATEMADEEAIRRAKKLAAARSQQRGGRMSTILSDSDSLGG